MSEFTLKLMFIIFPCLEVLLCLIIKMFYLHFCIIVLCSMEELAFVSVFTMPTLWYFQTFLSSCLKQIFLLCSVSNNVVPFMSGWTEKLDGVGAGFLQSFLQIYSSIVFFLKTVIIKGTCNKGLKNMVIIKTPIIYIKKTAYKTQNLCACGESKRQ